MNHRLCSHPATSSARARCRRAGGPVREVPAEPTPSRVPAGVAHTTLTDRDWELLLRNRARFTDAPWPTDDEVAASLAKIWCTTCHLLHDLPACTGNVESRRVTATWTTWKNDQPDVHPTDLAIDSWERDELSDRKTSAAMLASQALPTFANARALAADIPAGRYATREADGTVKFYRIDKPEQGKWAGYVFLKIQASDDEFPVKSAARQMAVYSAILEAGVRESSALYGVTIGSCGVCGRTLTDAESIADGIGPVCARKMGW